jgi:hypothetical protein
MKMSKARGNARISNILVPKQNKTMARAIRGTAGRTAEGLEPSIPYRLIKSKIAKNTAPSQFVPKGVEGISLCRSQTRYAETNGIRNA